MPDAAANADAPPYRWMLYGAYGYTGQLIARRAVAAGMRPLLAGRDARALEALATDLRLDHVTVSLDDSAALRTAIADVAAVAHCAGPFSRTAAPVLDACLATGAHYLDISGEHDVIQRVLDRSADAVAADVALLPASGFDVVPTDCLAALVAKDLPEATALVLAFSPDGAMSRGTMRTAIEGLASPALHRHCGQLAPVPAGLKRRDIPYASGTCASTAISWGDIATATASTGIGNVTVYLAMNTRSHIAAMLAGMSLQVPGLRSLVQRALLRSAARSSGPSAAQLAARDTLIYAHVEAPGGRAATRHLRTPNGYALTADAVVRAIERLATGRIPAGAHTPSQAHGAGFVLELDGVELVPA